jgi:hypothetical protein
MSNVTAKVYCSNKIEEGEGDGRTVSVNFQADYADDRNKEWSRYTPNLSLAMSLKGSVADQFEVGKAFTLTFTPEG